MYTTQPKRRRRHLDVLWEPIAQNECEKKVVRANQVSALSTNEIHNGSQTIKMNPTFLLKHVPQMYHFLS